MNLLQRIDRWGETHHPRWLDAIRVLLGVFLFYKGVVFIQNIDVLKSVINENPVLTVMSFWLAHYIVFAHLAGGVLIIFGLLTRVAILANIPILIGAIFFVHTSTGLFNVHGEAGLSILVLLLLVFFLVEGSGPISFDEYMRRHPA
ncbi:DoxX family protein [Chitinophaga pinensis]|uniref:DoxX family protein n=1 Tax=Chitinophaga pinensis (strain ATCC 43595 / DSM 2588 / LMG 13176 / NBRC 15968 / NCIMB 11800 / UQM 2034) TaxID=485918 RepID=A0A979G5E9_CHIPD|nr:DoxX family protein [Chitinophaga pinensis]ACU61137.1 DoxX family protein [Chitinophaga pinensis DSM 2588]